MEAYPSAKYQKNAERYIVIFAFIDYTISNGKIMKNCRKIWGDNMWYEEVVCQLNKDRVYSRQEIYYALLKEKPELNDNSFKWIISRMVKNGIICRKQRGEYVLQSNPISDKHIFKPVMNVQLRKISEKIEKKFPYVAFVCFESVQLNVFLNHLIGRNTLFVLVEKDAIDFVFRYLQEEVAYNILLRPSEKEWDAYCTGDNIVMLNLISETPMSGDEYHSMCIEQLLVDIVAEKTFRNLYSKSELENIYELADKTYLIDYVRLLRYARRRGKAEEVKKYIGGYVGAYTR